MSDAQNLGEGCYGEISRMFPLIASIHKIASVISRIRRVGPEALGALANQNDDRQKGGNRQIRFSTAGIASRCLFDTVEGGENFFEFILGNARTLILNLR